MRRPHSRSAAYRARRNLTIELDAATRMLTRFECRIGQVEPLSRRRSSRRYSPRDAEKNPASTRRATPLTWVDATYLNLKFAAGLVEPSLNFTDITRQVFA